MQEGGGGGGGGHAHPETFVFYTMYVLSSGGSRNAENNKTETNDIIGSLSKGIASVWWIELVDSHNYLRKKEKPVDGSSSAAIMTEHYEEKEKSDGE